MLFQPDDAVEITESKCGYKGPGVIVSLAYGNTWLVKIDDPKYPPVILVRLGGMRSAHAKAKKK